MREDVGKPGLLRKIDVDVDRVVIAGRTTIQRKPVAGDRRKLLVDETVAKLRARGVTIVTEPFVLDVISRKLAFFADPFGNLIELAEVLP